MAKLFKACLPSVADDVTPKLALTLPQMAPISGLFGLKGKSSTTPCPVVDDAQGRVLTANARMAEADSFRCETWMSNDFVDVRKLGPHTLLAGIAPSTTARPALNSAPSHDKSSLR